MDLLTLLTNLFALALPVVLVALIKRAGRQPLWAEAYRRLRRNRLAMGVLVILCVYGGVALVDSIHWKDNKTAEARSILDRVTAGVPVERTYSAPLGTETVEPKPHPTIARHLLGTDANGKDILVRTLKGCRTALMVGVIPMLIIMPVGVLLGMLAGYYGKRVDDAVQYTYTVFTSVPDILLLISLVLVLGHGILQVCLALGITGWVGLCRLVRGETLKHRDREYVRAARALGVGDLRIMLRHILPNLLPVVIISVVLGCSGLVLSETILTYLGVGVPPEMGSWGNMIDAARLELAREPAIWWQLTAASSALFLLVLSFNILGDALRDAVDPRLRSS
ncbi:MAG: ABC-type dipeptide/oligopeptide/nickel transport system, permease component [Chthonomonadaceae bacterium]|nr:ABC-type dipeptide/oligopeptide/nickel transport system, permease component [Chthonomonadaceae bacterium]